MLGTGTKFCSLEAVVICVKDRSNVKSESAQTRLSVATAVELLKGTRRCVEKRRNANVLKNRKG